MTNEIIKVEHVWKSFGKHSIFEDISLTVERGSVYGLVGLNGVGKTTLLRLLLGLLSPEKGHMELFGESTVKNRELLFRKCGIILEHEGFWGNLSIMDNLLFYAEAKGVTRSSLKHYLDENWLESGLVPFDKKVKHCSRGQKMQCALCRAFMGDPEILFLDEPLIALDLHANDHFCTMIKKTQLRGAAIIISSHQLELVDSLCDRVGILKDKTLHEINKQTVFPWIIITDNNLDWKVVLESCGAENIVYDNGWVFTVDNSIKIPECVSGLAAQGCRIQGVFRTGDEFSSAIRTLYKVNGTENRGVACGE